MGIDRNDARVLKDIRKNIRNRNKHVDQDSTERNICFMFTDILIRGRNFVQFLFNALLNNHG